MAEDEKSREPLTLKRWSARKLAVQGGKGDEPKTPQAADALTPAPPSSPAAPPDAAAPLPPLPPVESLTFESDFTPFLKADVDESLKRTALKKLLRDPRFNAMDGLDVYIDDYSKPDPIDPDVVSKLMQARYIFNPPQTRVNEAGVVEDVPVGEPQPAPIAEAEADPPPTPDDFDATST